MALKSYSFIYDLLIIIQKGIHTNSSYDECNRLIKEMNMKSDMSNLGGIAEDIPFLSRRQLPQEVLLE